jgi:PAS domain S-box-containing protein
MSLTKTVACQGDDRDRSLALLASIVESSEDSIVSKTLEGIITSWNPAAERMYGYAAVEIIGQPVSILQRPDQSDEMREILARIQADDLVDHYEAIRVRKDGSEVMVSLTVSPMRDGAGTVVGASSIARDITARIQAEEQSRAATQYARSLIEASLDPLVTISPEGKITDVNEATVKVTGVGRDELIGADFSDYFTDPDKARQGYQQVFAEGSVTDYPLTIRHTDGQQTDVLYNASLYKDTAGGVLGVFAAARDVTEQKKAEAKFQGLLESAPDAIVVVDSDGVIRLVNRQTETLFGYERHEILGQPIEVLMPDKVRERHPGLRGAYYVDPQTRTMGAGLELTARRRDGSEFPVDIALSPLQTEEGVLVSASVRDVTDRKRAQAEIAEQQAKEMERLAELERFQRLTVGRELKMIDLKREIAELRKLVASDSVTKF